MLCKWLCCEMQKEMYPATTVWKILIVFQLVLRMNKVPFNIFDEHNLCFSELWNNLDAVSVSLRKQVVGVEVSHAAVITIESF